MTETDELHGRLMDPGPIRKFMLAGNSTFTIRHSLSGERVTYKIKSAAKDRGLNWSTNNQDKSLYFVSVMTGGDNEYDFEYLGLLRQTPDGYYAFTRTAKSRIGIDALSYQVFDKAWRLIEWGCQWNDLWEFWHEGKCGACGRKLTVPESVASGFGPECADKIGL